MDSNGTPAAHRVDRFTWERMFSEYCDLDALDQFVLHKLAMFMDANGSGCRPGITRLVEVTAASKGGHKVRPSERTIRRRIERAIESGWLIQVSRGGRAGRGGFARNHASEYAAAVPEHVWLEAQGVDSLPDIQGDRLEDDEPTVLPDSRGDRLETEAASFLPDIQGDRLEEARPVSNRTSDGSYRTPKVSTHQALTPNKTPSPRTDAREEPQEEEAENPSKITKPTQPPLIAAVPSSRDSDPSRPERRNPEADRVLDYLATRLRFGAQTRATLLGSVVAALAAGWTAEKLGVELIRELPPEGVRSARGFLRARLADLPMPETETVRKPAAPRMIVDRCLSPGCDAQFETPLTDSEKYCPDHRDELQSRRVARAAVG